jgi:hypothetical protein
VPLLVTAPAGTTPTPTPVPPSPPPTASDTTWGALSVSWAGWDGSVWEMSSPGSPVWLTADGTRGLNMPPVSRYTSESPALAGSRWRGYRIGERPVFWPLLVYGDSTAEWRAVDRAWWATLRPDRPGTWTVRQPDGGGRSLTCRYADDSEHVFGRDPYSTGWQAYGVNLVAEDPFWRGEVIARQFTAASSSSFYGAGAPPFTISPSATTDTAAMTNPGDEPAWPVWTLAGPFTSATVGVAGLTIAVPFGLAAGKSLTIDTRPDRLSAVDSDGADRVDNLGAVAFGALPPGDSVPVSIVLAGQSAATSVTVAVEPLYYRAW